MRTEKEVREQLQFCYRLLHDIEEHTEPGDGIWRRQKRYIEALEWVLEEE